MLRTKLVVLIAVLLGALVVVTLALASRVRTDLLVDAEEQLQSSNEVVRLAARLHAYSVLVEASAAASDPSVVAGFRCPAPTTDCPTERHAAVLAALTAWSRQRDGGRRNNLHRYLSDRDPGFAIPRQPDLLLVSDIGGIVVARVGFDKDDWFGESRPNMNGFPAVSRAALGSAQHDLVVWREHDEAAPQLARVGATPVVDEAGAVLGVVTVGYFLTDAAAEEAVQPLYDIDVAWFHRSADDAVSFAGTTAATRPQFLDAVARARFRAPAGDEVGFTDLALRHPDVVHTFEYDGTEWMAVSTALATDAAANGVQAGFVVVRSVGEAVAPLERFATTVPPLAVAFLLLGGLGVLVVVREFVVPIEDISKGVQEVIAGNRDYMWEVDERSHLSDLAHSLNVMSARLQGKLDPDAFEVEGQEDWASMASGNGLSTHRPSTRTGPLSGESTPRGRARSASRSQEEP